MAADRDIVELVERLKKPDVQASDIEEALRLGLRSGDRGEQLLAQLTALEYGRPLYELDVGTNGLDDEIKELEEKLATRKKLKTMYTAVAGFNPEGLVFGDNSDYGDIVHAVSHADGQIEGTPSVLVSAAEEAYWRTLQPASTEQTTLRGQWTRTPAIYFKQDDRWFVAFDDSSDPAENIVLARNEELCNNHRANNANYVLPRSDGHISVMLDRARRAGRVVPVLEGSPQDVQTTEFGDHPIMEAIFQSVADPYGQWLSQRGRQSVNLYTLTASALGNLEMSDDEVNVRGVGLGGDVCDYGVYAYHLFYCGVGCARSVARAQRA